MRTPPETTPAKFLEKSLNRLLSDLSISNIRGFSVTLGEVFSSKLTPIDCRFDREIDGDLPENGVKFPQEMAPNGLRSIPEIGNKHASYLSSIRSHLLGKCYPMFEEISLNFLGQSELICSRKIRKNEISKKLKIPMIFLPRRPPVVRLRRD